MHLASNIFNCHFTHFLLAKYIISLLINIFISLAGVIPSVFLTAANIIFFGFWYGLVISFVGEALGAIVSFSVYRQGFRKLPKTISMERIPKVKRLLEVEGKKAFLLILSLRLLPFIASGLINIFSAMGKVSLILFSLASSLGKIPALIIEGYSVLQITDFTWQGKIILTGISIYLLLYLLRKIIKEIHNKNY